MKLIQGKWQNIDGSPVAGGKLYLKLSQDAVALGTTQVSTSLISFILDSTGSLPSNAQIWANDELQPQQTTYSISVVAAGGGMVWGAENIFINGSSPININSFQPTTQNVMLANPVLQNPTTPQSITGQSLTLTPSAPLIVQGNETVGGTIGVTGLATFGGGTQGASPKQQTFNSSGTFTIPAGTFTVKVTVTGAGGAGGGGGTNLIGGGGDSGATAIKWLTGLTPGGTLAVTVGVGGTGVSAAAGNPGSSSSVASGTQTISTITAGGGAAGATGNALAGQLAAPPTASGGDLNLGGTAGGSTSSNSISGGGAPSIFGGGAANAGLGGGTGAAGGAPGAGGGGAAGNANNVGGAGANGIVIFEWIG